VEATRRSVLERIIHSDIDLSIAKGQLAYSKEKVSDEQVHFLEHNRKQLEKAILEISNRDAFQYHRFTIGNYGSHRQPGITLFLSNIISGESAFTIFNVSRKRARTTAAGIAGAPLKGNRFIITKNYDLFKFWKSTDLKTPTLSDFSRHLGNIKPLMLVGEFNHPEQPDKLQASTIRAMNITNSELAMLINKSSIAYQQAVNNLSITPVNKDIAKSLITIDAQPKSTKSEQNCENKLISKKITSSSSNDLDSGVNSKPPSQQTHEEWLADFQ
jgi:hypothetical protein